jgi:hypothetical protein
VSTSIARIDSAEWNLAIAQYIAATKKGLAYSTNRALKNIGIKGIEIAKAAEPAAISRLESLDFWPALVAKYITQRKLGKAYKAIALRGHASKRQARTGRIIERAYRRNPGSHRSEEAAQYSAKIVRKRLVTIGFIKWFFSNLARGLDAYVPGNRPRAPSRTGSWGGFSAKTEPATEQKTSASVLVSYDYRRRRNSTARKAERILGTILPRAVDLAVVDIKRFAEAKLAEAAARHSARKVA